MSDKHETHLAGARWFKSSRSTPERDCVEVAFLPDSLVGVRDSKCQDGTVLVFDLDQWDAFTTAVGNGQFHRS